MCGSRTCGHFLLLLLPWLSVILFCFLSHQILMPPSLSKYGFHIEISVGTGTPLRASVYGGGFSKQWWDTCIPEPLTESVSVRSSARTWKFGETGSHRVEWWVGKKHHLKCCSAQNCGLTWLTWVRVSDCAIGREFRRALSRKASTFAGTFAGTFAVVTVMNTTILWLSLYRPSTILGIQSALNTTCGKIGIRDAERWGIASKSLHRVHLCVRECSRTMAEWLVLSVYPCPRQQPVSIFWQSMWLHPTVS